MCAPISNQRRALALALLPLLALAATTVVRQGTLPYEAHSQNDIDAWPGLLAVGTRFIKLDLGVCDRASCEAFSTFGRADLPGRRGNASDCFASGGADFCCICLRGDASTRPTLYDPFNTTYDLVQFLAAAPPGVPRRPLAPGAIPLRIGLDFGGSPGCGQLTSPPCAAGALIADWLLAMRDAIVLNGLAVEPYGDAGIGGLMSGLDAACGPRGDPAACTPTQRALQALPWPNEGEAPFDAADARTRVLNGDWTQLEPKCKTPGIFDVADKQSETPFLWYEQQDEYEFKNLFDEWASCSSRPPRRTSNNTGIVAVSNSAPAQFELFASSRIGRGLKTQFSDSSLGAPLLAVTLQAPGGAADRWAVLGVRRSDPAATLVYVLAQNDGAAPAALGAAAAVLQLDDPATGGPLATPLVALSFLVGSRPTDGTAQLVAATATGDVFWLSLNLTSGSVGVIASGALARSVLPAGFAVLSAALTADDDVLPDHVFAVLLVADHTGAAINISHVTMANISGPLMQTAALQLPGAGRAATAGGALTLSSAATGGGIFAGLAVWASAAPLGQGELFGASVKIDGDGVFIVARNGLAQGAAPRRIGFGAQPHLSSLDAAVGTPWSASGALVLLLATDSDCDGGLLLNNANFARCTLGNPTLDDSPFYSLFQSCAALSTYSLGSLASFVDLTLYTPASAGPWAVSSALGVCHPTIAHGKVGAASATIAGSLFTWRAAHPNGTVDARGDESFGPPVVELATLAVADGHVVDSLPVLALCGLPNEADGLSWAQWRLPQAPLAA
jgi:hypothetical protein